MSPDTQHMMLPVAQSFPLVLTTFSAAIRQALIDLLRDDVIAERPTAWDDQVFERHELPVRALLLNPPAGLPDQILVLASGTENEVEQLAKAVVGALAKEIGEAAAAELDIDKAELFSDLPTALEECDALYLEPALHFRLPAGRLSVMVGANMLPSVAERLVEVAETTPGADSEQQQRAMGAISESGLPLGAHVPSAAWGQLLQGVEVEVTAQFGTAQMTLEEVSQMAAGRHLTLQQLADEPLKLYVNGTYFADARLVMVDDESYGIEIVSVHGEV